MRSHDAASGTGLIEKGDPSRRRAVDTHDGAGGAIDPGLDRTQGVGLGESHRDGGPYVTIDERVG